MSLASLALGCRMRGLSQNAIFVGDVAEGRDDDPPGAGLADHLAEDLRKGGRAVSKPQNWRDSGWTFVVKVDGVEEEIVVARAPSGGWVVQVAPANSPSVISRWFGSSDHPALTATFELARAIHESLSCDRRFSGFRWRWDGPPDDHDCDHPTAKPTG